MASIVDLEKNQNEREEHLQMDEKCICFGVMVLDHHRPPEPCQCSVSLILQVSSANLETLNVAVFAKTSHLLSLVTFSVHPRD